MSSSAEEFRKRADECYRLSVGLKDPEHKSFALFLATMWLALAVQAEQKQAAPDTITSISPPTILPPPTEPQPKDQTE